jgi:hypothetical protein
MRTRRSQQEMVGFVLIVVLVVVGLLIFLIISSKKPFEERQNVEIENLLSVLMKHTTECAIVYEPNYDSVKDLIKSCYNNERCSNLGKMSCDYLNETIKDLIDSVMKSESVISAYELIIYHKDSEDIKDMEILRLSKGDCKGRILGAQERIEEKGFIIVQLKFCYSN